MGGWSHTDISLEDMLKLIKGFVDILILASGYQSSGQFAHWDPHNIKKAFQWGLFFENVFSSLNDYKDSVEELDVALSKLASDPYFPQGLTHISSATLSRARSFILEHLIHTVPLRDTHLKAFMTATIEMDLDELQGSEHNYLHVYLDKLMLKNATRDPVPHGLGIMEDSPHPCPDDVPNRKAANLTDSDFTTFAIQEIMKRQLAAACISTVETGVGILAKATRQGSWNELDVSLLQQGKHATAPVIEEQLVNSITWNHWRTRSLSYLLDKRTIRLVSGASMIFSAPKSQWVQVFERLEISRKTEFDLHEAIELLLLGCISSRWSPLIEHFMSVCPESLTISAMYHEVQNLLLGRFQNPEYKGDSKERGILEYLDVKLSSQLQLMWKLSPTLTAMSLPSWSLLLRLYASELAGQFKGKTTTIRCCTCIEDRKEHRDCEVAERIWCLYIFHVRGSHIICGSNVA